MWNVLNEIIQQMLPPNKLLQIWTLFFRRFIVDSTQSRKSRKFLSQTGDFFFKKLQILNPKPLYLIRIMLAIKHKEETCGGVKYIFVQDSRLVFEYIASLE
jgi:hypothetical protein